jgi:uncharacterized repeat protein (TIGR01451 family)
VDRLRRRAGPWLTLALAAVLSVLGLLAAAPPLWAQNPSPIVVTKQVNAEEAQIDETLTYVIQVSNNARVDSSGLNLSDPLPEDIEYVPESLQTNRGQALFDPDSRTIRWQGALKADETASIRYQVKVLPPRNLANCAAPIVNGAMVTVAPDAQPIQIAPAVVTVRRICPDLGDAPDSTNHFGVPMTAYPGPVLARYPTVYTPITVLPVGPIHRLPRADSWLGRWVSGERDADLLPDEDAQTNIQPPADIANRDRYDDGVLKWPTLKHCTLTDMTVQETIVGGPQNRYLNVWIDWNRDGDWEDVFQCPGGRLVGEWVVQNHITNLPNGSHAVTPPQFLAWRPNDQLPRDHWMRVSLTEVPAALDPATNRADGRGLLSGFRFGETEDYYVKLESPVEPKLEILKQADVTAVSPGGSIEYTIVVANTGSGPATGVIVHDPIPAGTSYVAGSATATAPTVSYNGGANRIEWTGSIPAGGSVTIKFKVTVSPQIPCDALIRNRVAIVDANGNVLLDASAAVKVICQGQPLLDIKKEADVATTTPGGLIKYTVTVVNSGTGPATGVTVHDPIPAGTSYVAGSATATAPTVSYNGGANQVEWTGSIPAGGSVTIEFQVQVSDRIDCGTTIHNRAQIVSTAGAQGPIAGTSTPVECPQPILTIKKSADVTSTLPGGVIEYTIVIANSGNAPATGVTMIDPIPAGTTFVAGSESATLPTVSYNGGSNQIEWTGTIPAGGSVTITFKVTVDQKECNYFINNRARLLGATGDALAGAEASVWVDCPNQPRLVIRKVADVSSVQPGGQIMYTIVIQNVGGAPALGVTMLDPIPAGTAFVAGSETATLPTVVYDATNNWVKWGGDIPAGGSVTITFKVTVAADLPCDSVIANRAVLLGANTGVPSQFAETLVKVDCGEPRLEIKKRADVTVTVPGGVIEYTIVVANVGTGPATGVQVLDPIPPGTSYVPGSATATLPVVNDSIPGQIQWNGNLLAGGSVIITFKVTVDLDIPCQSIIYNQSRLLGPGAQGPSNLVATPVRCEPTERFSDFGDAPDSDSNHHGRPNTAYPGPVLGHFPTVWDGTPVTEGSGPHHLQANQYWLGDRVTSERDADLLPDADGVTNILNAGASDVADQDKADDGWLNPAAPLIHCRETTLKVRISRALIPPPVTRMYLNVWIDGNRDGDWNDIARCADSTAATGLAQEWIVQNWWIDPTTIPAAGFVDVAVGTVRVFNAQPEADTWLRFTLSEQKAILDPALGRADGRGPAFPAAFRLGETEDYYRKGQPQGEPGQIAIEKVADPAGPVNVGDVVHYSVIVRHLGGSVAAATTMTDVLPAGVTLVGGPSVTELTPTAVPLIASFNPGIGPSGAVIWNGTLTPNATIRIDFRVRVRECVDFLRNRAVAVNTNGALVEAKTETKVNCQPTEPGITLKKSVLTQNSGQPATTAEILPGDTAVYYLTLTSTDGLSHTVHISDSLPSGLIAVATSASSGVANIVSGGQAVVWNGVVGPANSPVTIKILVRLTERARCEAQLVNVATWLTRNGFRGQSNPVTLRLACRDLGDAPDSTNHFGVAMSAYPGVPGNYPTVFAVAAPERGPRHERPRPFHLGRGVTAELEADLGFDADGVNNLRPAANIADLDKADDGLLLSTVSFRNCERSTMRVIVSIAPAAIAQLPNGVGYLNVWVDSNRDGDWADSFDCPNATGAVTAAREHIVIDFPVNAAALGAGLHTIDVPTSGPVVWPADQANRPAWLRLTLSERPSNKPFGTHGDGRGYDDPFRLGETEDYLLRGQTQPGEADLVVTKRGEIWPDYDPATGQRRWMVGWVINYGNLGPAAASNVHVIDTFPPPQTLVAEHSIPFAPHTQSGNTTLDYTVGNLPAGGTGLVIIRTASPFNTPPGTVLRNSVTINGSSDTNPLNSSAVATVTVPILPPLIIDPLAGTTCTTTVTVKGQAQPGVTVDLYVDGALHSSLSTDTTGTWGTTLLLADGSHDLHAVARLGGLVSVPSSTVTIIVESSLFWDPISLRFIDESGHVIIPAGRLDETGWSLFLRPGHTYTVSLRVCCADLNAQVTVEIGNLSVTLSDPDGDRVYTGSFSVPAGGRLTGAVRICVTCNLIRRCSDGTVLIDPEGTVFDVLTGLPIDGATVACMQAGVSIGPASGAAGGETLTLWPADQYGQINPQTVGTDGYFSFFTPQGTYRVQVNKAGYQPYESPDLTVVDAPVHHDVPLTPLISAAAGEQIAITAGGFEPAVLTIPTGTVVEWVNADTAVRSSTSITPSAASAVQSAGVTATTGWDSGLLQTGESYKRQFTTPGTYIYQDVNNPDATATIIVEESGAVERTIYMPVVSRR